jgi:hypothetical protein
MIAVAMRALFVPDRAGFAPLLDRVRAVKRMLFVDSVPRIGGAPLPNDVVGGGLTMLAIGTGPRSVQPICWLPTDNVPISYAPFARWWEKDLAVKHGGAGYTRSFLVYEMANTDAVHTDEHLDASYESLKGAISGITVTFGGGPQVPVGGVAEASMRQIAWEVAHTLETDQRLSELDQVLRHGSP